MALAPLHQLRLKAAPARSRGVFNSNWPSLGLEDVAGMAIAAGARARRFIPSGSTAQIFIESCVQRHLIGDLGEICFGLDALGRRLSNGQQFLLFHTLPVFTQNLGKK